MNERTQIVDYLRRMASTTMEHLPALALRLGVPEARLQQNAAVLLGAANDIEEGKHVPTPCELQAQN